VQLSPPRFPQVSISSHREKYDLLALYSLKNPEFLGFGPYWTKGSNSDLFLHFWSSSIYSRFPSHLPSFAGHSACYGSFNWTFIKIATPPYPVTVTYRAGLGLAKNHEKYKNNISKRCNFGTIVTLPPTPMGKLELVWA
jgi:hypothetical protein